MQKIHSRYYHYNLWYEALKALKDQGFDVSYETKEDPYGQKAIDGFDIIRKDNSIISMGFSLNPFFYSYLNYKFMTAKKSYLKPEEQTITISRFTLFTGDSYGGLPFANEQIADALAETKDKEESVEIIAKFLKSLIEKTHDELILCTITET